MSAMASQITRVPIVRPLVQAQIKESIKVPRHWLLWGNPPMTGEFRSQSSDNAENGSIGLCHNVLRNWLWTNETWWCHEMGTFSALLALHEWNPPVTVGFPSQRTGDATLIFSLMKRSTNWSAGDLTRLGAYCDVTVIISWDLCLRGAFEIRPWMGNYKMSNAKCFYIGKNRHILTLYWVEVFH